MKRVFIFTMGLLIASSVIAASSSNLMVNGDCEDPENPWKYWTYDYKEGGNSNYADNDKFVSILPTFNGKKNVIKMVINDKKGMGEGVWLDSPLIPFEQGCRYKFSISIQASAPYHLYVIGYQWKPGVKPYDNPVLFDMRPRFKGSFNTADDRGVNKGSWTRIWRDFPEKQLSNLAMPIIKDVKMMSLHVCGITGSGEIYFKDLQVEKLPGGYTGGKITDDDRRRIK